MYDMVLDHGLGLAKPVSMAVAKATAVVVVVALLRSSEAGKRKSD